jgi:hypothetical protein
MSFKFAYRTAKCIKNIEHSTVPIGTVETMLGESYAEQLWKIPLQVALWEEEYRIFGDF